MKELNPQSDQNQTPEDVATLYSWANLHGAKYRDFSAARAQTRETARLRAEQALEEEQRRQREPAQAAQPESAQRGVDESEAEANRPFDLEAAQAAQEIEQPAANQSVNRVPALAAPERPWQQQEQPARQMSSADFPQENHASAGSVPFRVFKEAFIEQASRPQYAQEESSTPRNPWPAPDVREPAGRPAWLSTDQLETSSPAGFQPEYDSPLPQPPYAAQSPLPQAPEDTLQGSRDRLTSRWFALRGVLEGAPAQVETAPAPVVSRAPSLAVFSLAGGVGKTSLVATLGRALSARGERVLLVDTAAFGLLPFFFGATDQRPGLLRTFSPPGASSDAPIQTVTIDPESLPADPACMENLTAEILKFACGASRIIVDLATASGATTRRIMRMAPMVLVPVIPDMNSVVSVSSIDAFFEHNNCVSGQPALPYYVLNQFDASLPLHLDVREVLREQLGERLLSFALRRAPAMSEALAEGMTVMDYAPGSSLAEDFATLAGWVKSLSAPATTTYRGVRWSER